MQLLRSIYGLFSLFIPIILDNKCSSYLESISRISDYLLWRMRWLIGDGNKINFWHQHWVLEEIFTPDHTTKPIPDELTNKRVADFMDDEEQ